MRREEEGERSGGRGGEGRVGWSPPPPCEILNTPLYRTKLPLETEARLCWSPLVNISYQNPRSNNCFYTSASTKLAILLSLFLLISE